jgi:hypothetical protein
MKMIKTIIKTDYLAVLLKMKTLLIPIFKEISLLHIIKISKNSITLVNIKLF